MPRLVDSIQRHSEEQPAIYLVVDEAETPAYLAAIEPYAHVSIFFVKNGSTYPEKLNTAADTLAPHFRYMALLNDDHEVMTPDWDRLFKGALGDDPFGVAYGPDGVWEDGQVPTAPFITTSMHRALGWVALPGLQHILVDNVWMDLAKRLDTLHFLPEVRIQHHHLDNGEAAMDATYAETQNNEARNQADRERWWEWMGSSTDGIQPDSEADRDLSILVRKLW